MVAQSLQNAATKFAQLAGEKKAKDDRLNYSLAKNELLQADLAATYQTRADDVLGRYSLSGSDKALLSAESDLIRERGRAYSGEMSRRKRIDFQRGKIDEQLDTALEAIMVEKSPPRKPIGR